jgi:hypothetical protein
LQKKNNMIITKLTGGLGNQMFQYAMGRSLAEKNQTEFKMDITGYKNQKGITPRKYALQIFNVQESFIDDINIDFLVKFFRSYKIGKILLKLYNFLPIKSRYYIVEPHYHFFSQIFNVSKECYLDGYWQSEKYFKDIENIVRKEFTLKKELQVRLNADLLKIIEMTDSVSVHIRRSDYITNKAANQTHGVCSVEYYDRAIEKIVKGFSNPHFFIFSDDIDWVKNNLKFNYPVTYVSDGNYKDYEELIIMSYCKHNIIANSSFSWWGAWLNKNKEKRVVAPVNWFVDKSYNAKDLILENWIKL